MMSEYETICDHLRRNRAALEQAVSQIPYFDPVTGASDCDVVPELCRQKEERARLLHTSIVESEAAKERLSLEIKRMEAELRRLALDDDAERWRADRLQSEINSHKRLLVELCQENRFARAAMREAANVAFPGTRPRRW